MASKTELAVTILISAVLGGALSVLCLLNLPVFYDQSQRGMIGLFLGVLLLFGIGIFFSTKWFVLPYVRSYSDWSNLLLIALLVMILLALFVTSSPYLWTVPQIQHIAVCYESPNESDHLDLLEAHDIQTNREYSPQSLGSENYPISIAANTCLEGTLLALTAVSPHGWAHGFAVTVSQKGDQEQATLRLNNAKKIFPLGNQDGIQSTETLSVDADPTRPGTFVLDPWGRKWMTLAKWASVVLSSAYVALVLYGISETVILDSEQ
jgi:hypothetical protein